MTNNHIFVFFVLYSFVSICSANADNDVRLLMKRRGGLHPNAKNNHHAIDRLDNIVNALNDNGQVKTTDNDDRLSSTASNDPPIVVQQQSTSTPAPATTANAALPQFDHAFTFTSLHYEDGQQIVQTFFYDAVNRRVRMDRHRSSEEHEVNLYVYGASDAQAGVYYGYFDRNNQIFCHKIAWTAPFEKFGMPNNAHFFNRTIYQRNKVANVWRWNELVRGKKVERYWMVSASTPYRLYMSWDTVDGNNITVHWYTSWQSETPDAAVFQPSGRSCINGAPRDPPTWWQFNFTSTTTNYLNPQRSHTSQIFYDALLGAALNQTIDAQNNVHVLLRRCDLGLEYRAVNLRCHVRHLDCTSDVGHGLLPPYRPIPHECTSSSPSWASGPNPFDDVTYDPCRRGSIWRGVGIVNGRLAEDYRSVRASRDFELQTDFYIASSTVAANGEPLEWDQIKTEHRLNNHVVEQTDFTSFENGAQAPAVFNIPAYCVGITAQPTASPTTKAPTTTIAITTTKAPTTTVPITSDDDWTSWWP